MTEYGTLYIIATPIGNLGDISYRAIEILKTVDVLFAEDTRTTKVLLDRYAISKKMFSYNAHATAATHTKIGELLKSGQSVGLVSDAGTPGISDPGSLLISYIYNTHKQEVVVVPIPGASALTAIVSVCPLDTASWVFYGFLPHKKGRATLIQKIADSEMTSIVYESSHRILKLLEALVPALENTNKYITIGRELTKKFEDIYTDTPKEVLDYIQKNPMKQKGEFVVCIGTLVKYSKA
jgi:16S rRNA (cytidine1402-2'-O)-methyltransferase